MHHVENGKWGGSVGWLLDGGESSTAQPPDIEMNRKPEPKP